MFSRKPLSRTDLLACSIGFGGLTVGLFFFALFPIPTDGPVLCTFKRMTGIGCPGCGLTRSISATMRLDFPSAFRWHLFGPPVVAAVLALWILLAVSLATRKSHLPDANARWLSVTALSAGGIAIIYWVVRLAMNAVP